MNAYNEYTELISGLFNITNIIISIIAVIALLSVSSIIKRKSTITLIKRSVKEAIRELEAEDEQREKELREQRISEAKRIAGNINKIEEEQLAEENSKYYN
ncbi:MAG: hypothetical protein PHD78_04290 [Bacilli bacterium]|nr:hypothetical protein [Bacilli bacterium]